jgi:hypothetical protein
MILTLAEQYQQAVGQEEFREQIQAASVSQALASFSAPAVTGTGVQESRIALAEAILQNPRFAVDAFAWAVISRPILFNDAWLGVDGNIATHANSGPTTLAAGFGSSGDPWDATFMSATCTLTFDSTHIPPNDDGGPGQHAYKVLLGATPGQAYAQWDKAFTSGAVSPVYLRTYLYFTANPGTLVHVVQFLDSAGAVCGSVGIDTTGHIVVRDSASATQSTSVGTIPLNAFFELEVKCVGDSVAGGVHVRQYNAPDGVDREVVDNSVSATGINTRAPISQVRFGHSGAAVGSVTYWMGDIALSGIKWTDSVTKTSDNNDMFTVLTSSESITNTIAGMFDTVAQLLKPTS